MGFQTNFVCRHKAYKTLSKVGAFGIVVASNIAVSVKKALYWIDDITTEMMTSLASLTNIKVVEGLGNL